MKRLIICEGKNDCNFLSEIVNQSHISKLQHQDIKFFNQNNLERLPDLKKTETREIHKLSEKTSPYKVLIKSESGKSKAITLFSSIMIWCFNIRAINNVTLMLDLDGKKLEDQLKIIEAKILNKKAGTPLFFESTTIKENNIFYLLENNVKIKNTNTTIGKFQIIFFASSLEDELDKTDGDSTHSIKNKISKFIESEEEQIKPIFSLALS